jgi:parallel beta-helix repeat protein
MIGNVSLRSAVGRKALLVSGLALGVCGLGPRSARADSTPVTQCGQELSEPGDYHLAQDLGPCPGHGVIITGSDVRLSLAGYTLSGVQSPGSCDFDNPQTGIDVRSPATGVRISGGTVTGFVDGISLSSGSRVTAMRVADSCFWGILVTGDSQVDTSIVSGSGNDGIALCQAQDAWVTANEVTGSARYGISISCSEEASDRNHIVRNILRDNGAPGGGGIAVFTGNEHQIEGNAISDNWLGIYLLTTANSTVRDNTMNRNRDAGIALRKDADGNTLEGNTAYNNGTVDLQDDNVACDSNAWNGNLFFTAFVAGGPNPGCIH